MGALFAIRAMKISVKRRYDSFQLKLLSWPSICFFIQGQEKRKEDACMTTDKKKTYTKPTVKSVKIDKAVMVAASRSGMGNCKITYIS